MTRKICLLAALLLAATLLRAQDLRLLVGTFTGDGTASGAWLWRFDPATGASAELDFAAAANPAFIIPSADRTRAWSVCEFNDGRQGAYAYTLGPDRLELINYQPATPDGKGSGNPCNILYFNGFIFTADYFGGTVTLYPVQADGSLGPMRRNFYFGPESRMHCCRLSPDGRWIFASDLGCDAIRRFPVLPSGEIPVGEPDIAYRATPGSGPRHFVFSADGRFCYVLGELGDTLTVLRYEDGTLTPVQELKAYRGRGKGSADIHLSPDGRFLYTSHRLRGEGIAIFAVDPQDGTVRRAGFQPTGRHPRNFVLSPDGRWLLCACRDDNAIEVYARDTATGALTLKKDRTIRVNHPVCLQLF